MVHKKIFIVRKILFIPPIGGHGIFFRGGRIFCPQNFFIAFLDVSRHAERFDAMLFFGEKKIQGGV